MTEGRLEVESKSQECLVIIKREVTSNNLPKRRVLSSTHGVVGGRRLVTASYPISEAIQKSRKKQRFFLALLRSVDEFHRVNVKGKKLHNENGKHRLHLF